MRLNFVVSCAALLAVFAASGCARNPDSGETAQAPGGAHRHGEHGHGEHAHAEHGHAGHAHVADNGQADAAHASAEHVHSHAGWWCDEHGVPEEVCGQCDAKLAAEFQRKGDWCKRHDRPDSQCFVCHPDYAERFAALYEAKFGTKPPKSESDDSEQAGATPASTRR